MKRAFAVFAMVSWWLASGFAADAPPSFPAPAVLVQFLGLSEVQVGQFQQILGSFQSSLGATQQQMGVAQQQLDALLSQESPDPAQLGVLVVQIRALQRQAGQVLQSYHAGFLSLLTPEQTQKVQAVAQAGQLQPAVRAFAELQLIEPPR